MQDLHFCSFSHLQHPYNVPITEIFNFRTSLNPLNIRPGLTSYEYICANSSRYKGIISQINNYLNGLYLPEKSSVMVKWETEIGQEFTPDEWSDMLINMHKSTRSMSIKETAVKLHTRWYLTPRKVHLFYPTVPDSCFRGCQTTGSFLHTFWSCPVLQPIRQKVASKVGQITGSLVTLNAPMYLLFTQIPKVMAPAQKLAHTLFCAVLWATTLNRRTPTVPWPQVMQRMETIRLMEKVQHTIKDTMHVFDCKWNHWIPYGIGVDNRWK